jgi:hypothetical protein
MIDPRPLLRYRTKSHGKVLMLTSQKVIDAINDQIGYEFNAELQYYAIAA